MINEGLFTSEKEDWGTPQDFFDALNRKFDFLLDVAADDMNHKCANYFDKKTDGLKQSWSARNWMNPPYGKEISAWCAKADEEAKNGKLTVALLPARTDTKWFHEFCAKWHHVFIRGRLYFSGVCMGRAPFPSMIVYFGIER